MLSAHRATTTTTRRLAIALGVLSALALACASLAAAQSPWWHLTSGTRPTYLTGGLAKNEVQVVKINATEGEFVLADLTKEQVKNGEFFDDKEEKEPDFAIFPYNAEASVVQQGLEVIYGEGNVEVTGGPVGKPAVVTEAEPYVVTFKHGLADQPVELMNTELSFLTGTIAVTEHAHGRSDGEVYLTAENVGDLTVSGELSPVHLQDVLPKGFKAVAIAATKPSVEGEILRRVPLPCKLETLTCTLSPVPGTLAPYDQIEMRIAVVVEPGAQTENTLSISGGEGFQCIEVNAGAGSYNNSGCAGAGAPKTGGFERVGTGPVPASSRTTNLRLGETAAPFGVESYELVGEEEGGAPVTQAGAHPFQLTTTITLNQTADARPIENVGHKPSVNPVALPKDVQFKWPPGLIGNPSVFPQCTDAQFYTSTQGGAANACPADSAVGVATVTANEPAPATGGPTQLTVPLFNLKPGVGEPARFGFFVAAVNLPVVIDTAVRSGGDYGVTVSSDGITQTAALLSSEVTVWGVPGDPRHNRQRGNACLLESRGRALEPEFERMLPCSATATSEAQHPPAFLSMPTSCTGPMSSTVVGDSWKQPLPLDALPVLATAELPALEGCNRLPFTPSINVTPDGNAASSPTGLNVDVHVPQEETLNAGGLSEGAPKDITVTLPAGVAVNPSSGDGLAVCSEGLVGFTGFTEFVPGSPAATFTPRLPGSTAALAEGETAPLQPGVNFCPDASKIGTVKIKTPILPNPIEGSVYLGAQNQNPFGSLIALYLVAEDPVSGVLVKLVGETRLSETGQITTTFKASPQAPFEDAELHFFGGERAPLATPTRCGAYTSTASLAPWSGTPPVTASSTFNIASGPHGGPCTYAGQALPFSPSLTGGTTSINAGGFSPLTTTIAREDGQQDMQSVTLHMPPGLSGLLSGVKLCPEPQANEGKCGPESEIGETTVSAGVGGDPVSVKGGRVYITGPYGGAPFGLSIVNPVKAGPFDLEHDTSNPSQNPACDCVVVRAKIEVDPHTAALTVTTDQSGPHAIPRLIDGIPVQIQKVNVTVNRSGFTFNPTNCNPSSLTGTIVGYEGATQPVSVPFQATNCAVLKFTPQFTVSTSGRTSKAKGASLKVKVAYPNGPFGSQANIKSVKVELPKQLPSRLTTLQKACTARQFASNPAGCPAASIVGHAIVHTPVLPVALEGPAYFVSNGGEAFPNLIMVLQGDNVTVDLVGDTFINKHGITSSTFKATPDVPFSTFELNLPEGPHSALAANANLCATLKAKTVRKRVTVHRKGHTRHLLRSIRELVPTLSMPTTIVGQSGARIEQDTKIGVEGCRRHVRHERRKRNRRRRK
jgi:hypothetical protein